MKFISEPVKNFIRLETSGSIVLFAATAVAIILANSPFENAFRSFWENRISIGISEFGLEKSILLWINDGLMTIFFFLIGLEIKREMLTGELNTMKKVSLPFFAALGGMMVPAFVFLALNSGKPGIEGWGIPMAADIAFTLGILKILGPRVPAGLKIFLTTFAILDDLGAVLVIAIFYSTGIVWMNVVLGICLVAVLLIASQKGFYNKYLFFLTGIVVWYLFLKSGIHPTIAGVLMATTIPLRKKVSPGWFYRESGAALSEFIEEYDENRDYSLLTKNQMGSLDRLEVLTEETVPPLQHLEHKLHGWVSYIIIPLFALANAGVLIAFKETMYGALTFNIGISMFAGNVTGISLFSYLAVKLGLAELPENTGMNQIIGAGFLGGLGFTMSLFINNLAYSDPGLLNSAKTGILAGSLISGIAGYLFLKYTLKKKRLL